ncbi:tetratricopeptide repeat protein, partial [Streptomyces rubiginosohelvolus]|uniref:tetratricopeptide repeat protein n=2 Tax=Streptomyces TaxID=1883 RepID=UPI0035DD2F11
MTPKGGGGRSWGPIRAENQHAENLAKLLRAQVDASGKTLRDLESEIKVSKAQVGVYLAGKIPDDPFIIAVIEATVPPALRERRTNEALYLRKQALVPSPRTPSVPPSAPGPGYAVEQAAAQARQLETYDRLTRALEQQAEVERAKNNSDKLVMILLNMIHQLDRRVSDLVRERDELRDRPRSEALEDAERKLARAEEQEERARTELQRAEEKQRQAEKLQTRLQDQLRQLTDELDRLRAGDADSPINTLPTLIYEVDEGRRSSDPVGDDIDAVLARATTVNDEDNDTLTRVTSQLNEAGTNVVQDNPPDNASTEDDGWWVVSGDEHPDSLHTRLRFAVETAEGGDPNRAVDLVNGLIPDMTSALGADHPDTLTARHNAATWAGEAGDATGAAADLADLIPRLTRALGPDHPNTHTARHEAAHWAGQAGDATGAAAALADLINDRTRLFGPNHPGTLLTRHEAARWAGEAGNIAGAAAAFADLVSDRTRVLGPDHPDTLRTRQ